MSQPSRDFKPSIASHTIIWLLLALLTPVLHANCPAPAVASASFNAGQFAELVETHKAEQTLAARLEVAKAYQYLGRYTDALRVLDGKTTSACEQAWLLGARIEVLLAQGEAPEAALQQLAGLVKGQVLLQAYYALLQGQVARASKHYDAASQHYQHALALLAGEDSAQARRYAAEARVALAQNQFFLTVISTADGETLSANFSQALTAVQALPASFQRSSALLALGRLALAAMDIQATFKTLAAETLTQAVSDANTLQHPQLLSYAYGYSARLSQTQAALSLNQQALFYAQQSADPWLLYQWHHQHARLQIALGNHSAALDSYRQAIRYLQDSVVREHLLKDEYLQLRGDFRQVVGAAYFELIEQLLGKQVSQAHLKEVISILEHFKTVELEDYYHSPCLSLKQDCVDANTYLDAHTRLLYPVVLKDKLVLLLLDKQNIAVISVPVPESRLRYHATRFLRLLGQHPFPSQLRRTRAAHQGKSAQSTCSLTTNYPSADISADLMALSQQLYDWLIRPLHGHLDGVDTLLIAGEGPLRNLPLAALHDGKQFTPYAIGALPMYCLSATKQASTAKSVLLGGLSEAIEKFPALPCVEYEIEQLQKIYPAPQTLLNPDFTRAQLETTLQNQPSSIIHLASHGQFGAKPEDTFLLTYQERLNMTELSSLLRNTLDYRIDLLTLSACETALGNERSALGLAGTVLKSGVISSLASLWQVDDVATPIVLLEFYRHYQSGLSKVQALHKAQQAVLTQEKYRNYRHPYFWSAFVLLGDWR